MKAFASYHPSVLFFCIFVCIITVSMFINNPITLCLSLLGGILFCLMLQRRSEIPGNIGFYVPLFLIIAVTNPLFSHNGVTPLFFLNGNPITLEAFSLRRSLCRCCGGRYSVVQVLQRDYDKR